MKVRVSPKVHSLFSLLATFITASLVLLVAGCGSTHNTVPPPATAPTVTIAAAPATIDAGKSSTLTVVATNATSVTIAGSDGKSYTLSGTGGTQSVSPAATTTYTATATGSGGTATAKAVVTVNAAPTAPTVTITASPTSIPAGSSSTLTVAATNASTVSISGTDGSSYTLSPTGGTQKVTPAATTTYTVTAATGAQTATATATVTVTAPVTPPTVTIAAAPATITAGSNSTLTVVATNATTVTITGSDSSSYNMAAAGGTQVVAPAATTIYTVTATSGTLTATATATVTVVPAPPPPLPTVTITANPTSIAAGASSTLTVVATNATNVSIAGTDGSTFNLQPAGGTETVTPTLTSTYTVTATGAGGTASASVIVTVAPVPTVTIAANPASIASGSSSNLTVTATNVTSVAVTGTDGTNYTLTPPSGTQSVSDTRAVQPTSTTTYTATADSSAGTKTATATVTVTSPGSVNSINHVIFLMQENHSFDNYFGMLNPYRQNNGFAIGDDGVTYNVDGIDDKTNGTPYDSVAKAGRVISNNDKQHTAHTLFPFKSTCVDDMSSAWTESYGDVALGNFTTTRPINMNGFVSNADGFANSCAASGKCSGSFTDLSGDRAMGYYDQGFLNYYYYMASQFALSDRWFSPISSKSIPNRIATFTGGTTQGLTNDPSSDDHLQQLKINSIFQELDQKKVSWKIYYTVTNGLCIDPTDCNKSGSALYPATSFSYLQYSYQFVNGQTPCTGKTVPSSAVGDKTNSFCIDPTHIAPLNDPTYGYFADLKNGTLPSFAFIEAGYGNNDEHPGSGQSVLAGQAQVAKLVNALMGSTSWKDSVFFLSYDEGGGPYDHVPPVPGHTNDFTTATAASDYPTDISTIAVDADNFKPCVPPLDANGNPTPTFNCDLKAGQPGSNSNDAAAVSGFAAQEGFRVPNMVISPFTRKHYVSHIPMDHTAIIKFVEDRFIGSSASLTPHDAAEPNLLDFFDFTNVPWSTPPTPPTPAPIGSSCQPAAFHG